MKVVMVLLSLWLTLYGNIYAAPSKEENNLQDKCSKGAEEFFKHKFGTGLEKDSKLVRSRSYTYNYNKKLDKCFILISIYGYPKDNTQGDTVNILLYDINENKELGSLFEANSERPRSDCIFLNKPAVKCSREEWNSFVKPYIQE